MLLRNAKSLTWMIVFWFALLQTFSPLIHGHIGADSADQGLHIHGEFDFVTSADHVPVLKKNTSPSFAIAIESGLPKEAGADVLAPVVLLVVWCLAFTIIAIASRRFHFFPAPKDYLQRHCLSPRAPPLS